MPVHVKGADGDAKFWMEPEIELAMQHGLPPHHVSEIRRLGTVSPEIPAGYVAP